MSAAEQAVAYAAVQSWAAVTNPSATTVDAMLVGVTHSGVKSTDGTWVFDFVSAVFPLTRLGGGVWLALA